MENKNPIFSIKNFRSFGEEGADFELAPITVLTGCNSAGKSSLVKALMLLARQSTNFPAETSVKFFFEDTRTPVGKDGLLEVGLPEFKLGRFKNVLHNKSNDTIEMSYTVFSQYLQEYVRVKRVFKSREDDTVGHGECVSYRIENADGTVTYYDSDSYVNSNKNLEKKLQSLEDLYKQSYQETDNEEIGLNKEPEKFSLLPDDEDDQLKAWSILDRNFIERTDADTTAHAYDKFRSEFLGHKVKSCADPDIVEMEEERMREYGINITDDTTLGEALDKIKQKNPKKREEIEFLNDVGSVIFEYIASLKSPLHVFKLLVCAEVSYPRFLRGTSYISSDSVNVRRSYSIYGDDKMDAALRGQYEKHPYQLRVIIDEDPFTDKWIKKFEIGDYIEMKGDDDDSTIKLFLVRGDEKRLLADEGYGITQLVSLLFNIENHIPISPDGPEGSYLPKYICVEEPEVHLHPKYQSMLAEMFVEAYRKYNIHFIIETHSEYMIRKLQVMVADKECELKPSEVSINYVDKDEDGIARNCRVNILADGRLDGSFGEGFFDEAGKWSRQLLKLSM